MDVAGAVSKSANTLSPISTYTICFGFAVQQPVQHIHSKLKRLQQIPNKSTTNRIENCPYITLPYLRDEWFVRLPSTKAYFKIMELVNVWSLI